MHQYDAWRAEQIVVGGFGGTVFWQTLSAPPHTSHTHTHTYAVRLKGFVFTCNGGVVAMEQSEFYYSGYPILNICSIILSKKIVKIYIYDNTENNGNVMMIANYIPASQPCVVV